MDVIYFELSIYEKDVPLESITASCDRDIYYIIYTYLMLLHIDTLVLA